ncbi:hypothetical protein CH25_gp31 [Mycobacterium phage EagleEye]|uniref:Uncharacterized protein n=1 Tax=Mycobacterium phage EagleEye TaxID=1429759 RepID=W0LNY4_9CAUD|nr:hypothetical protein CH25_gp31 [Mycobacterium phage EagleEye]AHG23855.1 hypothetical protein PBI_EAGLEEYE_75 [Mycobacterium phage EagleEye]QDK03508.1 hypothetical protein SEA_LUCYEDI_74 [Mycobacterium phage Lucyedi]QNJ55855.1 hypothetical protein SEA_PAINTERBOY_73 [Mycobacterium phage PainterBoy]
MKIKITEAEAIIVKSVLSRHAHQGSWYRQREVDVCVGVIDQITKKFQKKK